jgi:phosphoribosylformylglycinamidine cyclo-ligase
VSSYARAGVDTGGADSGVAAIVAALRAIDTGSPSRSVLGSGHYASVLRLDDRTGLALSTDGVGTKLIVAEQLGRFETVGIDCVAMNVNDVICVGATPIAMLDYVAVEEPDPAMLAAVGEGLRRGAEDAGVEIPGGELAVMPELVRGHPSPRGLDLLGFCVGLVELDRIVTGAAIEPGDVLVGLPSSGVHSNGLTLARSVLSDLAETPPELGGASVGDVLLEPTVVYVRAVRELLESDVDVRGLAHITGDGLLNLLRLEAEVGYRIDSPLAPQPVFELIASRGDVPPEEMYEVFNMGCGFVVCVAASDAPAAVELLSRRHPGAAVVGSVTDRPGTVELPHVGRGGGA